MAQPAVIPVKTGQKVPSVFGQWKAVITGRQKEGTFFLVDYIMIFHNQ